MRGLGMKAAGMAVNPERRLFRYVLAIALQDDDALEWLASEDGRLVCDLADVDRGYVTEKIESRLEKP